MSGTGTALVLQNGYPCGLLENSYRNGQIRQRLQVGFEGHGHEPTSLFCFFQCLATETVSLWTTCPPPAVML